MPAATKTKAAPAAHGAPGQRAQGSRKGKRAWRKHVDLDDLEERIDGLRAEEREFGSALHTKTDAELFVVDTAGDDAIRARLPKRSTRTLTAAKILAQRSAVPAVTSRPTTNQHTHAKNSLTRAEKARLLRIGRKDRRGPFNSIVEGQESGPMELSEAAKASGTYDVWSMPPPPPAADFAPAPVDARARPARAPEQIHAARAQITVPAVRPPAAGASYNPPADAHAALLAEACAAEVEAEEVRVREAAFKARVLAARRGAAEGASGVGMDMDVDEAEDEEAEEGEEEAGEGLVKRQPGRKTKQQRARAARHAAAQRALAEATLRKRMAASVDSARRLAKLTAAEQAAATARAAERRTARMERLKQGLGGRTLGGHVVPKGEVDVQLGDELSESLRGLRPEGSVWRERFVSMQQRALVEPRAVVVPSRGAKMKVYEKHDFKRFDAAQA